MSETEKIKLAIERSAKAITLKPALGQGTGVSTTTIKNGLTCEVEEGPWKFLVDMPSGVGGNAQGPTPGVYGRAALGSCLAICYMMMAARMRINIKSLEVVVQADYDDAPLLGVGDKIPGYSEVRYIIKVESDVTEEEILAMLDAADQSSPYLHIFSMPQNCKREIRIVSPIV